MKNTNAVTFSSLIFLYVLLFPINPTNAQQDLPNIKSNEDQKTSFPFSGSLGTTPFPALVKLENTHIPTTKLLRSEPDKQSNGNEIIRRIKRGTGSSSDVSAAFLDIHNELRRREGGADMLEMVWSPCLADMAREWVSRCIFEHGQPTSNHSSRPQDPIGQNIDVKIGFTEEQSVSATLQAFYSEKSLYNSTNRMCQPGKECSDYTQVVWAKSKYLGCAVTTCYQISVGKTVYNNAVFSVCNYFPGGNVVDSQFRFDPLYQPGTACSKCPTNSTCNNGLCVETVTSPELLQSCDGSSFHSSNLITCLLALLISYCGFEFIAKFHI